jgi:hypothetical protein
MDIAGAKALKKRLGPKGTDDAPAGSVNVRTRAAPVFLCVGSETLPVERLQRDGDDASVDSASVFGRLGLTFR